MKPDSTTDDIALCVEICGLYDGTAVLPDAERGAGQPLPAIPGLVATAHRVG